MKIKDFTFRWKKKLVLLYVCMFCRVTDRSNRKIQDIFDLMIKTGLYGEFNMRMCTAIDTAVKLEIISSDERVKCNAEIMVYLNSIDHSVYMTEALRKLRILPTGNECNYTFKERINNYCLPVFQNWENRPAKDNADAERR